MIDQDFKIGLVILLIAFFGCNPEKEKNSLDPNHPNFVLIISDDQSWTDYSFMGHSYIQTPRLDKLAEEGLTFTHGYTTAPLCSPALASIATGLYPHQHGILGNDPVFNFEGTRYSEEWLGERMKLYKSYISDFEQIETVADYLKPLGYSAFQAGKWWLGNFSNGGFQQGMTHGDPKRGGRHGDEGLTIGREGLDPIFSFIDSAKNVNRPFYIWYAPFLPHAPHNPPDSLRQKYLPLAPTEAVANYWAMCEWFDITCGQLIDYVDESGLGDNTLFVYVTDNGWIQDPDKPNRYAPRSKREPYDMGIRTPIIFRWKNKIKPELNSSIAVSSIDIASTILGICGIKQGENMQGINILDRESLLDRDLIFAETYAHDFSGLDSSLYYRIAIDLPYKLILPDKTNLPDKELELYNLVNDPYENINLAKIQSTKTNEIRVKLENWWEKDK